MGIRYIARAATDCEDRAGRQLRLKHDDELPEQFRGLLDLDKCYSDLQAAFGLDTTQQRPCAELVRGRVTQCEHGWVPFERYLPAYEVAAIARDLEAFIRQPKRLRTVACRFEDSIGCAAPRLQAALDFTKRLATDHRGLVYTIG